MIIFTFPPSKIETIIRRALFLPSFSPLSFVAVVNLLKEKGVKRRKFDRYLCDICYKGRKAEMVEIFENTDYFTFTFTLTFTFTHLHIYIPWIMFEFIIILYYKKEKKKRKKKRKKKKKSSSCHLATIIILRIFCGFSTVHEF